MRVQLLQIHIFVMHIEVRKSTTFEDCDVQKIYWCFNNITIYFDSSWLLNTLMNSVSWSLEWVQMKLDESMARRQLKSPRSLSGRSIHLTLVTKWSWSWSWMTYCHPLCAMSIGPPILRYSYFKIWPCVWSKVKVTFDHQNSKAKVMVKVKPIGHIWGLEFSRYVCFSFRGNQTIFGWDIANSILDLENSRSRSWPRSNPMITFEP